MAAATRPLLLRRDFGKHRQREHAVRRGFADGESAGQQPQAAVSRLEMQRDRIMDPDADALGGQFIK